MKMHHLPVFKLPKGEKLVRTALTESEKDDPVLDWFWRFKENYSRWLSAKGQIKNFRDDDEIRAIYADIFPDRIRDRMRFVGLGTTRIAFVSDTNVCLKFQYNDFRQQSKNEIIEALAHPDAKCFPRLFDYAKDGSCMAFETAEEPTTEVFTDTFGQMPSWISDRLIEYAKTGERRMLDIMADGMELNAEQRAALEDLMAFQAEIWESQRKCLTDLFHEDNWGVVYRNGMRVLIVTDFGL